MQILKGLDGLRQLPPRTVMTIGNFDGIHVGHRRLLETCAALRVADTSGVAVVTFEPHPLTVLKPALAPPRLSPPRIKTQRLQDAGVDYLVELSPSPAVLNLSAEQFWTMLRDEIRPTDLVEGENFTFGKGRVGTIERLRQWTAGSAVTLHVVAAVTVVLLDLRIVPVSSSLIRWLIASGRVRDAAICLGHPYVLEGRVVRGHQRGRTIGVPTANLDCGDQHVPAEGVYAGRCTVAGATWPAAISIGAMETFGRGLQQQIEAHLIGFDGDLYDQVLQVELLDWIRDQRRFPGVEALKAQMQHDLATTRRLAPLNPARPIAVA